MKNLREVLKTINNLKKEGIIRDYAIGGGIAAMLYAEPACVTGMDVFFIPSNELTYSDGLMPRFRLFKTKKTLYGKTYTLVKGVLVRFVPANNDLIREAITNPRKIKYQSITARLLTAEYLIAIMFDSTDSLDRIWVIRMLQQAHINKKDLSVILRKYSLTRKYGNYYNDFKNNIKEVEENNARTLIKQTQRYFKAKDQWRIEMAKLPFAKKMKIVSELQQWAHIISPYPSYETRKIIDKVPGSLIIKGEKTI